MAQMQRFCTFFLNKIFFGVEVGRVQEVIRYQEMTRIPLAPPEIRGLINLRGQIVIAIDLRYRLSFTERLNQLPMNVVIRNVEGAVSFLVDEIGDVVEVDETTFELPPPTLTGVARELIYGAYKLNEKLLLVLDVDKTMDLAL
jgi:purine-binding chemotaxis protein CheW